jgi:hypothetical protein
VKEGISGNSDEISKQINVFFLVNHPKAETPLGGTGVHVEESKDNPKIVT